MNLTLEVSVKSNLIIGERLSRATSHVTKKACSSVFLFALERVESEERHGFGQEDIRASCKPSGLECSLKSSIRLLLCYCSTQLKDHPCSPILPSTHWHECVRTRLWRGCSIALGAENLTREYDKALNVTKQALASNQDATQNR